MSATNYSICPRCKTLAVQNRAKELATLEAEYGVIPAEEWIKRHAALQTPLVHVATMREDYNGIGVDENTGVFFTEYRAECDHCTYQFSFQHSEQTDLYLPPHD